MQKLFRRLLFHYWYFGQPPWDTGVSPPELLEFLQAHQPGRAIDIGCGSGTNVVTLARAGWKVTGVDFAPRAIKLARRKIDQAGIQAELLVRDATRLEGIAGPFDLAFDLGCFHTIPSDGKEKYLEQLERILAPNGFWLLYGFLRSDAVSISSTRRPRPRPGLGEAEIGHISSRLALRFRQDGVDNHGESSSAWFLFQKE